MQIEITLGNNYGHYILIAVSDTKNYNKTGSEMFETRACLMEIRAD